MSQISSWVRRHRRWATPIVVVALLAGGLAPGLAKPVAADSGYSITGTVTNGDGTALHGYHVDILLADGSWYTWTLTNDSGVYQILLPQGSYKVQFKDDTYGQYASGLFYMAGGDLTLDQSHATVVSLTSDVTLDTVALPPGYSISGTVTGSDGPGLAGIKVDIWCMTTDLTTDDFPCGLGGTSMAGGSYMIGGLPAGSYKVRFSDPSGTYVDGLYSTAGFTIDADEATAISVPQNATGVSVEMPLGVHLSGRVTDPYGNGLPNMQVSVNFDSGGGPGPGFGGPTGPNGYYSLAVLAGTYTVNVQDFSTGTYLQGCYGGGYYVADPSFCATVTVGTSDVTGIDVFMTLGAAIIGTVSDLNGNGLPDIQVTANPGNIVAGTAGGGWGDVPVGWYGLTLPSGSYTVSFHDRTATYAGCYASGASGNFTTDPSACTPVTVGTSNVEIDVTMPMAGPPITITAPSGTMTYGGPVPAITPTYSGFPKGDDASSLTTQPTCTTTATSASPVGTYPVTCSGAVSANYSFAYVGGTLTIAYRFDGFLQPINDTGHSQTCGSPCPVSIFKAGSTVPVKFQLKDANGDVVQAAALPIWATPVQGGPTSAAIDEATYTDPATSGSTFRVDGSQYIYNWSTKGLQAGFYYRITVILDDGTTQSVYIGLR